MLMRRCWDGGVASTCFQRCFAVASRLDWHWDSPLFAANIRNATPPPSAEELTRLRCRKISASLLPDEGQEREKAGRITSKSRNVPVSLLRNTARCESETKVRQQLMRIAHPILVAVSASAVAALMPLGGVAAAVEEPQHSVAAHDRDFEIRDYPALTVAKVTVPCDWNSATYARFRKLARFIFGAQTLRRRRGSSCRY